MNWILRISRPIALTLAVVLTFLTVPMGIAQAGVVPTDRILTDTLGAERARIVEFLVREDIQLQLQALGVDPAEAASRVAALTDTEVARIAGELDRMPAGQGALGVVIGAILVVFIVLLITDILGFTKVFPFTRSQR